LRAIADAIIMAAMRQQDGPVSNKANIHRFVDEALNRGILDVVDETRGEFAEQSKARIRAWRRAFPDFHTTIENMIAEGDWVAFQLRHEGTHLGEFLGIPPTGRRVDFRSMVFNRFTDGVVVENWGLHDHARALEQLREGL
jgi:predicted ester cyclase